MLKFFRFLGTLGPRGLLRGSGWDRGISGDPAAETLASKSSEDGTDASVDREFSLRSTQIGEYVL